MDKTVGIVIINYNNTDEEINRCIVSIKNQTYRNMKVICIGGEYSKSELLNKALATIVKTDYILPIEGQQTLDPKYLETTLNVIEKHPVYVGAVYTNYIIDGYKKYLHSFDRRKLTNGYDIPNTALIKREVFEKCGLYDADLTVLENWDMWLRISEKYVLFHTPEHLYIDVDKKRNINIEKLKEEKIKILEKTTKRNKK